MRNGGYSPIDDWAGGQAGFEPRLGTFHDLLAHWLVAQLSFDAGYPTRLAPGAVL